MKLDTERLEKKIREYREFKSCSESTLMALIETAEYPMSKSEICKLACGFAGGMGGTFDEGTCGALTGALMANGLLINDEVKIKSNAKILFETFKDEYALTAACSSPINWSNCWTNNGLA